MCDMKKSTLTTALILSLTLNVLLYHQLSQKDSPINDPGSNAPTKVITEVEPPTLPRSGSYPFIRVVDGDTITVGIEGRTEFVRLIGIDSPEPNDPGGAECYANEATNHMRELTRTGTVALYFDESQGTRDTYGRLLAYVELPDGTDIGAAMVRDGYAREYTYDERYERANVYRAAELEAIEAERGLWAPSACNTN